MAMREQDQDGGFGKKRYHSIFAMPERQPRWEAERDALKRVFEKHGVQVLRPRLLTKWEQEAGGANGYRNSYVRDPGLPRAMS
jgi:hypothetical protein